MPISIEFDWSENENQLTFIFQCPGVTARNCDVFLSEVFVKVSCPPKLAELDLLHSIDYQHAKTRCRFNKGKLTLTLQKLEPNIWGTYKIEGLKADIRKRRQESIDKADILEKELREKRDDFKHDLLKKGESQQWKLDRETRETIDNYKAEEKRLAEEDVYTALDQMRDNDVSEKIEEVKEHKRPWELIQATTEDETTTDTGSTVEVCTSGDDTSESQFIKNTPLIQDNIFDEDDEDQQPNRNNDMDDIDTDVPLPPIPRPRDTVKKTLPPVRKTGDPGAVHTERRVLEFTKPARPGVPARDLPGRAPPVPRGIAPQSDVPEQQDPVWLKDRADGFVAQGDYQAALNAYTGALKEYSNARAFANRALCNLYLGNLDNCLGDCDHAQAIINLKYRPVPGMSPPPVDPEDAAVRAKVHIRKGVAYLWKGNFAQAIESFQEGLDVEDGLEPETRTIIKADIERIQNAGKALDLKSIADLAVRRNPQSPPLEAYDEAIAAIFEQELSTVLLRAQTKDAPLDPDSGVLYANRSQVRVQNNDLEGALEDGKKAMELLQQWPIVRLKAPKLPERPQRLDPPTLEDHTFRPQVRNEKKDENTDDRDWIMKHSGEGATLPEIPPEYEWIRDCREKMLDNAWIAVKKKLTQEQINIIRRHLEYLQNACFTRKPKIIAEAIEVAKRQNEAGDGPCAKAIRQAEEFMAKLEEYYEAKEAKALEDEKLYDKEVQERAGEQYLAKHCVEKTRRRLVCKVLLRQATAKKELQQVDDACELLEEVLRLEPHNSQASDMLLAFRPPIIEEGENGESGALPPILSTKTKEEENGKDEDDESDDEYDQGPKEPTGDDLHESAKIYMKKSDYRSAYSTIQFAIEKDNFSTIIDKVKCMINGLLCLQKLEKKEELIILTNATLGILIPLREDAEYKELEELSILQRMECACYSRRGWAFASLGRHDDAAIDAGKVRSLI